MINLASLSLKMYNIERCMASPTNPIVVPHCCKNIGQHAVVLFGEGERCSAVENGCHTLFSKIVMLLC